MRILIKDDQGYADELKGLIYNYAKSKNIPAHVQIFKDRNENIYEDKAEISLEERIYEKIRENGEKDKSSPCLIIKKRDYIKQIPYRNILYFSKDKHYTDVHTLKETVRYLIGFKELTDNIPEIYKHCFIQCYRSIIVNLPYVYQVEKDSLRLNNNEELPVSQTYSKNIKKAFHEYFTQTDEF